MVKLKNVLRCYVMRMGIKGISSAFGLSRNTVRKYVHAYQEKNISANVWMLFMMPTCWKSATGSDT